MYLLDFLFVNNRRNRFYLVHLGLCTTLDHRKSQRELKPKKENEKKDHILFHK